MSKQNPVNKIRRKLILSELGLTEVDMDKLYSEASEFNWIIKNFIKSGLDWRNLIESQIRQIPNLLSIHEANLEKERQLEIEKLTLEKQKMEKVDSLNDVSLLIKRFEAQDLTEDELSSITWEDSVAEIVDTKVGEPRRWSRSMSTIIKLDNRYFCIKWEDGLTECQENSYDCQPEEVTREEKQVTTTVVSWMPKK